MKQKRITSKMMEAAVQILLDYYEISARSENSYASPEDDKDFARKILRVALPLPKRKKKAKGT
ncbi:MAG: hypothetical protein JWP25_9030 [Bradyrhizobium sp.]|nr:hypothetical protein [Bradyrhizobium sp.]